LTHRPPHPTLAVIMADPSLRSRIRDLYEGPSEASDRFRYALLAIDLLTVTWLVASSFLARGTHHTTIDLVIGLVFLSDFLARLWISRQPARYVVSFWGIADLLVIFSLLVPIWGEGLAFLRVLRLYRVFHSPETLVQLRDDIPGFRRNETTIRAALNLLIFIFAMTALVYQTQSGVNDKITNYVDALYFTVATLSTTGFGDITLVGNSGKLLSVAIMIFGISLFLRLVQVILRPAKAHYPCPTCGLRRHDHDAVHCKACGTILNIPDDGSD
jgi:voltage-gated potassium channel